MKEIIPNKLIVTFGSDGKVQSSILQYRIKVDGVMEEKYYTMGVDNGIKTEELSKLINDAKSHTAKGEKINV
jgi:hypothetical protein